MAALCRLESVLYDETAIHDKKLLDKAKTLPVIVNMDHVKYVAAVTKKVSRIQFAPSGELFVMASLSDFSPTYFVDPLP